jgi:cell division protease FtsH
MIDEEVRAIVEKGYARATQVLTENRQRLLTLADKLIAEETVEGEEFESLFSDLPPKTDLHGELPQGFTPGAPMADPVPLPNVVPPSAAPSPNPSPS